MKKQICNTALYVILDAGYISSSRLVDAAKRIVDGGCSLIQFRDKKSSLKEILDIAIKIKSVLPKRVIFILNDHVKLVKDAGADGVHLGQNDTPISLAREMLGSDAVIGLSTHSYQQALLSKDKAIDYVGYGPIFKTKTKPLMQSIGFNDLPAVKRDIPHPVFAIGGLNRTNLDKAIRAGADGIAVVSAILESPDIEKATREILSKIKASKSPPIEKAYEIKVKS